MPALFFADLDTLRLALASGVVPPQVGAAPAVAGFDAQGRLWLEPDAPLPRDAVAALGRLGVQVCGRGAAEHTVPVGCWQQLLPLQPAPFAPSGRPVLFELTADRLPRLAAELRRLGRRRLAMRWSAAGSEEKAADSSLPTANGQRPTVLLRVTDPPFFTLGRALDRSGGGPELRAYAEAAPRVWVEVGFRHPLADQIRPPDGTLLLLRAPDAWSAVTDEPFETEVDSWQLSANGPAPSPLPTANRQLPTVLRLERGGADEPAELWVLHEPARETLERFIDEADDALLTRLGFAVTTADGREGVLLRALPGQLPPPPLAPPAAGYRPYLKLPNLFLPCGQVLRPNVRRDAVRRLLADAPDRITWLRPAGGSGFAVESAAESAFRPLAEWVEYRLRQQARPLAVV